MKAAQFIRESVAAAESLRRAGEHDVHLHAAILAVKHYQTVRFRHSYRDLLAGGPFQLAAQFFLDQLYGVADFSERDAQFAKIAGAIERLLPAAAVSTAVALARLHVLTEQLDCAMAKAWISISETATPAEHYVKAWRQVGQREQRLKQLQLVLELGWNLDRLTRKPGLRKILKMMRLPAAATGLAELQRFLEAGFDTFVTMTAHKSGPSAFLNLVETRETNLIDALFAFDFKADRAIDENLLPAGFGLSVAS